jgi:hypothetical protein
VSNAFEPQALIAVGAISLTMSVLVVVAHLWKLFFAREPTAMFDANDPLLLVFFYAVVVIFAAVTILD